MAERRLKELLKDSTGEDWEQAECPPALGWLDQPWGVRVTEHRAVCHGGLMGKLCIHCGMAST